MLCRYPHYYLFNELEGLTKTAGGTLYDNAHSNAVDTVGNIYIVGDLQGTVDFDPGAAMDNHTTAGQQGIFLTSINADGTYGWTKTMGGTVYDTGASVVADASGNLYLSGVFNDGARYLRPITPPALRLHSRLWIAP